MRNKEQGARGKGIRNKEQGKGKREKGAGSKEVRGKGIRNKENVKMENVG